MPNLEKRKRLDWNGQLKGLDELKRVLADRSPESNLSDRAYPDDWELAELAEAVYYSDDRDKHRPPDGWTLVVTAHHKDSGYYGGIYWSKETGEVVVCHRGTSLWNSGSLKTDVKGVIWNQDNGQQWAGMELVEEARLVVGEERVLSVTGHSLGGWLAAISAFSARHLHLTDEGWEVNPGQGSYLHAVLFDPPGPFNALVNLGQRVFQGVNVEELDLKTYLSSPNIVNTCGKQVGPLYAPPCSTEWSGFAWLKRMLADKIFCLVETCTSHPIQVLKQKLAECKRVDRWPALHWPQVYVRGTSTYEMAIYVYSILRNLSPDLSSLADCLRETKSRTEVRYAEVDWPRCSALSPNERRFTEEWLALGMGGGEAEHALNAYQGLQLKEGDIRHKKANTFVHLVKRIVRTKPAVVNEVRARFKANPSLVVALYKDRWKAYNEAWKGLHEIPPLEEVEGFLRDKRAVLVCVYHGDPELGRARLLASLPSNPGSPGPIVLTLDDLIHLGGMVSLPDNHVSPSFPAYSHLAVDCLEWREKAKELLINLMNRNNPEKKLLLLIAPGSRGMLEQREDGTRRFNLKTFEDIPLLPWRKLGPSPFQCKIRVHDLPEIELKELEDWEEFVDGLDERELRVLLEGGTIQVGRPLRPIHNVTTLLRPMEPLEIQHIQNTDGIETILQKFPDVEAFLAEVSKRDIASKVVFAAHAPSPGEPYIARFLYDPCFYLPRIMNTAIWKIRICENFKNICEGANYDLEEWTKEGFPSCCERSPGRKVCYVREDLTELVECPGGLIAEIRSSLEPEDGPKLAENKVVERAPRIAVLAGEPGAGKSTLLNKLREHFVKKHFWTIWIELKNWRGGSEENGGELWERLAPSEGDHPLVAPLLRHFLAKGLCALLLDGFDEARESSRALELIGQIERSRARAVVTTRTRLAKKLEDVTGAPALTLVPLDDEEKETLLVRLWKLRHGPAVDPKAAKRLLQEASAEFNTFLANPLHLAMVAEVFSPNRPRPIQLTRYSLFQEFVNIKFDIYAREKTVIEHCLSSEEGKMLKAKMEEECGVLAVTGSTEHEEVLARVGLVSNFQFVHDSLREFFLAKKVLQTFDLNALLMSYLAKEEYRAVRVLLEEKCDNRELDWSPRECCGALPWNGDNSALHRVASEGLPCLTRLLLKGCPPEFLLGKDVNGETALGVAEGAALHTFLESIEGREELQNKTEELLLDTCFMTTAEDHEHRIREAKNATANGILDKYSGLRKKMKKLLKKATAGDAVAVREILEGEKDVRLRKILLEGRLNNSGNSVLHLAAKVEDEGLGVETVRVLLEKGASVHWQNRVTTGELHKTPLHQAANRKVAEVLLDAGANLNARDSSGHTPLLRAVMHRRLSLFKFLLTKTSEDELNSVEDKNGMSCVHWAARIGFDYLDFLLKHIDGLGYTLDLDRQDRHGFTPLIHAAKKYNWEVVECLLAKENVGIDKKDFLDRTVHHWLNHKNQVNLVEKAKKYGSVKQNIDTEIAGLKSKSLKKNKKNRK